MDYQDVYHDQAALGALIRSADVVVLPYDSREQVTSGVLIEAVAAGVPVVATAFPHAVELLTGGPGSGRAPPEPGGAGRRHPADPDRAGPGRPTGRPRPAAGRGPALAGGGGPVRAPSPSGSPPRAPPAVSVVSA